MNKVIAVESGSTKLVENLLASEIEPTHMMLVERVTRETPTGSSSTPEGGFAS